MSGMRGYGQNLLRGLGEFVDEGRARYGTGNSLRQAQMLTEAGPFVPRGVSPMETSMSQAEMDAELSRVMDILVQNKDKNFVQRILNPNDYPSIDKGDGVRASHLMSWGEADGKYYVYPSIIYDGKTLTEYGDDEAFDAAIKAGDYIAFDKPEDADWFSRRYKAAWGEYPE